MEIGDWVWGMGHGGLVIGELGVIIVSNFFSPSTPSTSSTQSSITAYLVLVKYIWTGRDAHPTRVSRYRLVPHLAAKCCIFKYNKLTLIAEIIQK